MTTLWEGYADWDRDPSWDAVAVRIRVEQAYNEYHSYGVIQPVSEMAEVFEEESRKQTRMIEPSSELLFIKHIAWRDAPTGTGLCKNMSS